MSRTGERWFSSFLISVFGLVLAGLVIAACSQPPPGPATAIPLPTVGAPTAGAATGRAPQAQAQPSATPVKGTAVNTPVFAAPTFTPFVIASLPAFATIGVSSNTPGAVNVPVVPTVAPVQTPAPVQNQAAPPTSAPAVRPSPALVATTAPAPATTNLSGRIVFEVASGGPIYVVNANGSALRRLTNGLDPTWSPNGSQVAFTRFGGEAQGVYFINSDGSGEGRLHGGNEVRFPAWSPDGSRIVFNQLQGTKQGQFCFRGRCFDTGKEQIRTLGMVNPADKSYQDLPSEPLSTSPSWLADGQTILFRSAQGLQQTTINGAPQPVLKNTLLDSPIVDRGGDRVAVMLRHHDHWDIGVCNPDGSGLTPITQADPNADHAADNVAPAWSPDGQQILFLSNRSGTMEAYVMNADGSNQRLLFPKGLPGISFNYQYAAERIFSWTP